LCCWALPGEKKKIFKFFRSGKSALLKQIHFYFTKNQYENSNYKGVIRTNAVLAAKEILKSMKDENIRIHGKKNRRLAEKLLLINQETILNLDSLYDSENFGADIQAIWECPDIQKYYHKKGFRGEDNFEHYLNSIERISQLRYYPTNFDLLSSRIKVFFFFFFMFQDYWNCRRELHF
jgi:hypothetical protein